MSTGLLLSRQDPHNGPPSARVTRFGLVGLLLLVGWASIRVEAGGDPLIRLPSYRRKGNGRGRRVFSVDDFGAVGDGLADDTKAFEDAWKVVCSYSTKAVLDIPAGKTYLVWPVSLSGPCQSKVTLRISGTVIAPDDPAVWDQFDPHKWLYFVGINHMTVTGGGIINGIGEKWWAQSCKTNKSSPCEPAPTAIYFHKCKNLRVHDLNIVNSQQMHVAFSGCSQVMVSGLEVVAPADSPNTDGIHISSSTSVIITDSTIKTGDDCISIVSQSSRVWIKNIVCGLGHGISIGSLGKSKGWDQVHDVVVDGALFTNTKNGARIKTWQGGRGFVHGITFRNLLMMNVSNPIVIDQYYGDKSKFKNETDAVKVSGISYMGVNGTSASKVAIKFNCSDTHVCQDIFLEDIQLTLQSGAAAKAFCSNAKGFSYGNVVPPSCLSSSDTCGIRKKVDEYSSSS